MKSSAPRHSLALIALHWTSVALIAVQIAVALTREFFKVSGGAMSPEGVAAINFHKSLGLLIIGVTIFRFAVRAAFRLAEWPDDMPAAERELRPASKKRCTCSFS